MEGGLRLLWDVRTVDAIVFLMVIVLPLSYVVFRTVRAAHRRKLRWRWLSETELILLGGLLAVFVAYAALRNQAKLEAEGRISDQGYELLAVEIGKPEVRCLYDWGDGADDARCLKEVVADPQKFSLTMLYIEETLYIFKDALTLQELYGSYYYEEINYWVGDVGKDPTGLFSFYAVNYGEGENGGRAFLEKTGVKIIPLCENYRKVLDAIRAAGREPESLYCGEAKQ